MMTHGQSDFCRSVAVFDIEAMVCEWLSPSGSAYACEIEKTPCTPYPDEIRTIARAVPSRRAEFSAGRFAARRALERIGAKETSLPRKIDGGVIWPNNFCGSITHDVGIALAAVSCCDSIASIGVDLTSASNEWPKGADDLITSNPMELYSAIQGDVGGHQNLSLLFCAKEASIKCLAHFIGRVLDFKEVVTQFDDREFSASLISQPLYPSVSGHWAIRNGLFVCLATITEVDPSVNAMMRRV
jgi:4'-phosphopantetheinyl transferase EntD